MLPKRKFLILSDQTSYLIELSSEKKGIFWCFSPAGGFSLFWHFEQRAAEEKIQ